MTETREALKVLKACAVLLLLALCGLFVALAKDLLPARPSPAWWQYHRACILAVLGGASFGANLVGLASIAYAVT